MIQRGNTGRTSTDRPCTSNHRSQRWLKSASGRYNSNIDASFPSSLEQVGLTCVFVMKMIVLWFSLLCSLEVGEALDLYHTLVCVVNLQMDNVDFHLDSKKVINYFREGSCDITE